MRRIEHDSDGTIYYEPNEAEAAGDAVSPHVAKARDEETAARVVACVNACEGMDDPAAALAEVRDALQVALTQLRNRPDGKLWRGDGEAMNALDAAITLLGGAR